MYGAHNFVVSNFANRITADNVTYIREWEMGVIGDAQGPVTCTPY